MLSKLSVRALAVVAAMVTSLSGCGDSRPATSDVKFDSAHSIALDGIIDDGRIIASSSSEYSIKDEISEQLFYTIGQLNGYGGVSDMNRLESTISEVTQRTDGRFDVKYAAKLFISWPRERAIPATMQLIMPARGDYTGLANFYAAYGSDESSSKKCMASEAHEVSLGIFWYYYRPLKSSCNLRNASTEENGVASRFNIRLATSGENTSNKSPEYGKVWEDGKLVVTAIFGKYEEGATGSSDAGISAFSQTYYDLLNNFGQPVSNNLSNGQQPSATNNDVRLLFNTQSGPLDIHLYLVDGIRTVNADFRAKYNERTKISDFVSYSGHSGLGANIRAMTRMGQFVQGQYQIFLVNGCDTFAYVEGSLRQAHADVNPGFGPDKFFDIITNAMPSYFHMNSTSNLSLIRGLVGQTKTYRQILQGFDQNQRAAVTGEQDNVWPAPFGG